MVVQGILELTEINRSYKIKETQIKEKTTETWKFPWATHTEDYAIPYFFNSHSPGNRKLKHSSAVPYQILAFDKKIKLWYILN